jgi:hypothetical protein
MIPEPAILGHAGGAKEAVALGFEVGLQVPQIMSVMMLRNAI